MTIFALERGLSQAFYHVSRFASANLVASKQRLLRWPDLEIEFLAHSWHSLRYPGELSSPGLPYD